MAARRVRFGAFYDFRNPGEFKKDWTALYRDSLAQIAWLDSSTNFDGVSVSEHHFTPDGYSSSTLGLALAIASRTERIGIATNILQLPLHHPLRIAEDSMTIDIVSGGRFRLGVANGYREQEFAGLGTTTRHRRERMEEAIEIIRQAFSGETFSHDGKHWSLPELQVTPGRDDGAGPQLWLGGTSAPVFDRAARLGDGFFASVNDEVIGYLESCERHGVPVEERRTCRTIYAIVEEDPERALDELGPYMLHQMNEYINWGFLKMPLFENPQQLVEAGLFSMHDANSAIEYFNDAIDVGVQEIHLFAQVPGEPVESGTRRLQYISDSVIPAFDSAGGAS